MNSAMLEKPHPFPIRTFLLSVMRYEPCMNMLKLNWRCLSAGIMPMRLLCVRFFNTPLRIQLRFH